MLEESMFAFIATCVGWFLIQDASVDEGNTRMHRQGSGEVQGEHDRVHALVGKLEVNGVSPYPDKTRDNSSYPLTKVGVARDFMAHHRLLMFLETKNGGKRRYKRKGPPVLSLQPWELQGKWKTFTFASITIETENLLARCRDGRWRISTDA